eukprot:Hpha_TRINITY_DN13393_c0_g1::TRINITY_DN13393_c0_g1_i1::g.95609::m.95609
MCPGLTDETPQSAPHAPQGPCSSSCAWPKGVVEAEDDDQCWGDTAWLADLEDGDHCGGSRVAHLRTVPCSNRRSEGSKSDLPPAMRSRTGLRSPVRVAWMKASSRAGSERMLGVKLGPSSELSSRAEPVRAHTTRLVGEWGSDQTWARYARLRTERKAAMAPVTNARSWHCSASSASERPSSTGQPTTVLCLLRAAARLPARTRPLEAPRWRLVFAALVRKAVACSRWLGQLELAFQVTRLCMETTHVTTPLCIPARISTSCRSTVSWAMFSATFSTSTSSPRTATHVATARRMCGSNLVGTLRPLWCELVKLRTDVRDIELTRSCWSGSDIERSVWFRAEIDAEAQKGDFGGTTLTQPKLRVSSQRADNCSGSSTWTDTSSRTPLNARSPRSYVTCGGNKRRSSAVRLFIDSVVMPVRPPYLSAFSTRAATLTGLPK